MNEECVDSLSNTTATPDVCGLQSQPDSHNVCVLQYHAVMVLLCVVSLWHTLIYRKCGEL